MNYNEIIDEFLNFCQYALEYNAPAYVELVEDRNELATLASYNLNNNTVKVYSKNRALADILRSIAHELVHHKQLEDGRIDVDNPPQDIGGVIEDEANAVAGQLVKAFGYEKKEIYESLENIKLKTKNSYTLKEIKTALGIKEQDRDSDSWSDEDIAKEPTRNEPFTPFELAILKLIRNYLTKDEIEELIDPNDGLVGINTPLDKKWVSLIKLVGLTPLEFFKDPNKFIANKKYLHWALDNWTEDGDYASIKNPIKTNPKIYRVLKSENGTQIVYQSGEVDVVAFDDEEAEILGDDWFYEFDGEMGPYDYGDYDVDYSEIDDVSFVKNYDEQLSLNESKDNAAFTKFELTVLKLIHNNLTPPEMSDLLSIHTRYPDLQEKWNDIAKLVGLPVKSKVSLQDYVIGKKYIKWALDNWTEDGDYASIKNPIKDKPKVYIGRRQETRYQTEYHNGDVDVVAYDEDGAENTIEMEGYEWGWVNDDVEYGDDEIANIGVYDLELVNTLNESEDKKLKDLVFKKKPTKKHKKKMNKSLGVFEGFPIDKFKNNPPPKNESEKTEDEIEYLENIPLNDDLVKEGDDIDSYFENFLKNKDLDYPQKELDELLVGVDSIILNLKYHYNRPRPKQIADTKNLELNSENLKSAKTPSYPSGHATQGTFISRYLSDLYPQYKKELTDIGKKIGFSRNVAKVHYPTDIKFGEKLGNELYDFVKPKINSELIREFYRGEHYDWYIPGGDEKLKVTKEVLYKFLDTNHREKLKNELTGILNCLEDCYNFYSSEIYSLVKSHGFTGGLSDDYECEDCGWKFIYALEKLDMDLVKFGLVEPDEDGVLIKPFPTEYNLWINNLIKEIKPNFFIDKNGELDYVDLQS